MILASEWSGEKYIRAFVTEAQKEIIERNPTKIRVIRDFHGYGNDYTLQARYVCFINLEPDHWNVLKEYRNMVEVNEDEIYYLIRDIENFEEMEKFK